MTLSIDDKLAQLGIELPNTSAPVANYVPYIKTGSLVFVSGQICAWNGELMFVGRLGEEFDVEDGYQAARICGLNLISHLKSACNGNLDNVKRVVKLGGFVNSTPLFTQQPQVINGASDLMVEIFGKKIGSHARFAVSTPALPRGIATEVDGIFEVLS